MRSERRLLHRAMDRPWFKASMGFGYRPICWQGHATLAAMATAFLLSAGVWFTATEPLAKYLGWSGAALAAIAGHAVVLWKLERRYDR